MSSLENNRFSAVLTDCSIFNFVSKFLSYSNMILCIHSSFVFRGAWTGVIIIFKWFVIFFMFLIQVISFLEFASPFEIQLFQVLFVRFYPSFHMNNAPSELHWLYLLNFFKSIFSMKVFPTNSIPSSVSIRLGFLVDEIWIFSNVSVIISPVLFFNRTVHPILLKVTISTQEYVYLFLFFDSRSFKSRKKYSKCNLCSWEVFSLLDVFLKMFR